MRAATALYCATLVCAAASELRAQSGGMQLPETIVAGSAFSIQTTGAGKGVLLITGPAEAIRREVNFGQPVILPAGVLYNAGIYVAVLSGGAATESGVFTVRPAAEPETISLLAKPSRLSVGLRDGISGAAYVFDTYHNLITKPMPVTFQLSTPSSAVQARTVQTRNGVAWTRMDSSAKEGAAQFTAKAGPVTGERVIAQVPGDPCGLSMSAKPDNGKILVQTAPVRDCSGNAVSDGTVVTFTESYDGMQSTVDAPIKQGTARALMPAHAGARISVASGVVAGNELRWGGGR